MMHKGFLALLSCGNGLRDSLDLNQGENRLSSRLYFLHPFCVTNGLSPPTVKWCKHHTKNIVSFGFRHLIIALMKIKCC